MIDNTNENADIDKSSNEEEEVLTEWANPPTIDDLDKDYEAARSSHSTQVTRINRWLDNLNVTGLAKVNNKKKGRSSHVPKLIRKQAEWRYASLAEPFLSTEDIFNVSPVTYEDKKSAEQNQLVLNNQFNTKMNKVAFIDSMVRAAVNEGTILLRTGWVFEEEEYEEEVPILEYQISQDPAAAQLHEQLAQQLQENPEQFQAEVPDEMQQAHQLTMQEGVPVLPQQTGTEIVVKTRTLRNHPTVYVCNYKNIIIDPTCGDDFDKASFVIFEFETSLSELKKEGIYSNLDFINVEGASPLGQPDHESKDDSNFTFADKPRKKLVAREYWGFWDIHNTGKAEPFITTYVGRVIIRQEENPFPDKALPFVAIPYLPVKDSVYGEPDGELLEENQKIVGAVTRGMLDTMGRSANGQIGARKDALDATNSRRFKSGDDYEFNSSVDPKQAFHMHTYPEIPQSASIMLQMQNNEAESLTGVKAFATGITGKALGDTATGVKSAMDATSKRDLDILRRLGEGIKKVGRKFISMNSEFLSEEEVIRISNEEFVPVRRDDLAGNIDLKLSISTSEADNQKAEELAFMLQTIGPSSDPAETRIIRAEIAKLRKMPELAKRIAEYQPQPDPIAQEKAMLEIELLKAQIALAQSEGMGNQAKAELDMSKAREAGSKADMSDLDFVEQESGVKQERDLEKHGAQAEANMKLEVIKSQLNPKPTGSSK
jgi:hypothetical protein